MFSTGFRFQETEFQGRSAVNTNVSGFASATSYPYYNVTDENTAYNLGLEKKINPLTSIFVSTPKELGPQILKKEFNSLISDWLV